MAQNWGGDRPSQVPAEVLPPGGRDVRALGRSVVASGRAWVAPATFEGRDVVRICATHGETSQRDVEELVKTLSGAAC